MHFLWHRLTAPAVELVKRTVEVLERRSGVVDAEAEWKRTAVPWDCRDALACALGMETAVYI